MIKHFDFPNFRQKNFRDAHFSVTRFQTSNEKRRSNFLRWSKTSYATIWTKDAYFQGVADLGRHSLFSIPKGESTNRVGCSMELLRAVDIARNTKDGSPIANFLLSDRPLSRNDRIILADTVKNLRNGINKPVPIYEISARTWRLEEAAKMLRRRASSVRASYVNSAAEEWKIAAADVLRYAIVDGPTGHEGRELKKMKLFD